MFNDVVYFNDVKLKMLNRDVANLIYSLTGMRTFREIKRHFEEYPYEIVYYSNCNSYYICRYSSEYIVNKLCKNFGFEIALIIEPKTGIVMIQNIIVSKFR